MSKNFIVHEKYEAQMANIRINKAKENRKQKKKYFHLTFSK